MRLFVGTFMEAEQITYLLKMCDALKPHITGGRRVASENFHFTWLFLGETQECEIGGINAALNQAACQTAGFDTSFCGLENFPRGTVVAMLRNSNAFNQAYLNILDAVGRFASAPPARFRPHVTLLRDASFCLPFNEAKKSATVFNRPFGIKEFSLIESAAINGKLTYTPVSSFKLNCN